MRLPRASRTAHDKSPLNALDAPALIAQAQRSFDDACAGLHALVTRRREEIALLRRAPGRLDRAALAHAEARRIRDDRRVDADGAAQRRAQADAEVVTTGPSPDRRLGAPHCAARTAHCHSDEGAAALVALAEWVVVIDGDNPARRVLQAAQQGAAERLAERGAALDGRAWPWRRKPLLLEDERGRLEAGVDPAPPSP